MAFKPVVHPNACKVSHILELTDSDILRERSPSTTIDYMRQKLQAEDERLARLLPDPPPGLVWVSEIEQRDDWLNNRILLRVVYRLVNPYGC